MIIYRVEYNYGKDEEYWFKFDEFLHLEEARKRVSYEKRSFPDHRWKIIKTTFTEEEVEL